MLDSIIKLGYPNIRFQVNEAVGVLKEIQTLTEKCAELGIVVKVEVDTTKFFSDLLTAKTN